MSPHSRLSRLGPLDASAMAVAQTHLDRLTKPPGSLGRLEELVVWLAGVTGDPAPAMQRRAVVVAAADHGVALGHRVSAYPAEVTAQMVANFLAGGAAISALSAAAGAEVLVLDAGVASPIPVVAPAPGVRFEATPLRRGTADITSGSAMSRGEAEEAISRGMSLADALIDDGFELIAVGEMGIGNTTSASAIVAAITGRPVAEVTGRGTGLDDAGWERKVGAITRSLEVNRPPADDAIAVLAAVGGLEIGALVGVMAAAAARSVPVVLDGFITGAAALLACELQPDLSPRLLAAHRSTEPGHAVVLERLGLRPLLELDLRLGEGTGAALAILMIDAAIRVRDGMATFESAAVAGPSARP
jgi:nicotinate-nucleotide--dimethylbenzimidazole phosphoribosyltransferase